MKGKRREEISNGRTAVQSRECTQQNSTPSPTLACSLRAARERKHSRSCDARMCGQIRLHAQPQVCIIAKLLHKHNSSTSSTVPTRSYLNRTHHYMLQSQSSNCVNVRADADPNIFIWPDIQSTLGLVWR